MAGSSFCVRWRNSWDRRTLWLICSVVEVPEKEITSYFVCVAEEAAAKDEEGGEEEEDRAEVDEDEGNAM